MGNGEFFQDLAEGNHGQRTRLRRLSTSLAAGPGARRHGERARVVRPVDARGGAAERGIRVVAGGARGAGRARELRFRRPRLQQRDLARGRNWLGTPGAYLADGLLQAIGVAALALIVPLAGWGWRMTAGGLPSRGVARGRACHRHRVLRDRHGRPSPGGRDDRGARRILGALRDFTAKVAAGYGGWLTVLVPVVFGLIGGH